MPVNVDAFIGGSTAWSLARPKSSSFGPWLARKEFPGLRSRWAMPAPCAVASTSATYEPSVRTSEIGTGPRASRCASDSPSRSSMTR